MRKAEKEANKLRRNAEDLVSKAKSTLRDLGRDYVSFCIYPEKYDWQTIHQPWHYTSIRYSNGRVSVIAFKRSADVPDPPKEPDAMMYTIERPAF